jgi:hypothetical protein
MEKLAKFQTVIKEVLGHYVGLLQKYTKHEVYLVEDPIQLHYLIYQNLWQDSSRSYGCLVHVRIKNEKIYIEYDGTDEGFGDVFVEHGIAKQDIVLAFHAPLKRPYTGFGVA